MEAFLFQKSREVLRRMTSFDLRFIDLTLLFAVGSVSTALILESSQRLTVASVLAIRISVENLLLAAACVACWWVVLSGIGIYRPSKTDTFGRLGLRVVVGGTLCATVTLLLFVMHQGRNLNAHDMRNLWIGSIAVLASTRLASYPIDLFASAYLRKHHRVLIVGAGPRAQRLAAELPMDRRFAHDVYGFVDDVPVNNPPILQHPIVGALNDLEKILMQEHIDEVFIALPVRSNYAEIVDVISLCEKSGVRSQYMADIFETEIVKNQQTTNKRVVLDMVYTGKSLLIKRMIDIVGAGVGLLLLLPVLSVVAILVRVSSPGPIIFRQRRYGLNRKQFDVLKFRSMVSDAEYLQANLERMNENNGPTFKIKADPRMTRVGKFLRKTSLDELPQLWNVLRGEMSLVGPRPLNRRDVSRFEEITLMRRFSVKPGMTGLWQVSGRSNTTFERWIELDLRYIDSWSLALDAKILLKTIPAILHAEGAS